MLLLFFLFLGPTITKLQAEILKRNNVNGCNDISFGDHSILERDRIPPLKSHDRRWKRNSVCVLSYYYYYYIYYYYYLDQIIRRWTYIREQVMRGPTHRPSPTHIARKNPSRLYPGAQLYVSCVPSGNTFWPIGPSRVACSITGGSPHRPVSYGIHNTILTQFTFTAFCLTLLNMLSRQAEG